MTIVDAHHHLWDPQRRNYLWMTDEIAPIRRRFSVEDLQAALPPQVTATVAVQAHSSVEETRELLRAAQGCERIAGVVGWVELSAPYVGKRIADVRATHGGAHLVGIRHQVHDEDDPAWLVRPQVLRGLAEVGNAGLVYDLLVRERELPAACEAAARVPHLQFVVDHAGKPQIARGAWEPWSTRLAQLAAYPNVACKLSGLVTQAHWQSWTRAQIVPYARRVLDIFGPRRVLFGSDWPVCLLAADYGRVLEVARAAVADFTASERGAIFAGNARRIYRLQS